jgi:hypothetical protein
MTVKPQMYGVYPRKCLLIDHAVGRIAGALVFSSLSEFLEVSQALMPARAPPTEWRPGDVPMPDARRHCILEERNQRHKDVQFRKTAWMFVKKADR